MKSERRHELEHNVLADWLADTHERTKPYQNAILGGLILLAALIVVAAVWRTMAQRQAARAWGAYFRAIQTGQPGDLEDVAGDYPGSHVAQWSATAAADLRLALGCNLLFSDKPSALHELRRATDQYLQVLQQSREATLLERATFGLARAYEAQLDLQRAAERYQQVADRWPEGPYAQAANDRLSALDSRPVRELADKFAQWEPTPAVDDLPDFPATAPEFDLDALPDGPVFTPKTDFGLEGLDDVVEPDVTPLEPDEPEAESGLDEPSM